MATIGIVGGTGYTGSELLRLLTGHPQAEVRCITSRAEAGQRVADALPMLRGRSELVFEDPAGAPLAECDLVFFATPNGTAMAQAPALLDAGVRVIDLAADFRIKDLSVWQHWYGMAHTAPALVDEAVYGLPEINRAAIRQARLVANPGCYPTAIVLGLLPLLEEGLIDPTRVVADGKSGVSGAGRTAVAGLLMAEVGESFKAYSVAGHRHEPEIEETLRLGTGQAVSLTFVPHLVPMVRGIEATIYAPVTRASSDLLGALRQRYRDEPFVDVMAPELPVETRSVRGSNLCRVTVTEPQGKGVAVVQSVIDNLVKGAAGQAVQNMNLMLGFPETEGLDGVALAP
ncbi:N-acetyl-gamma-glutamyl-phosphate reductase [uncultured Thiohalocapsa sp.]|uniref:N-acetyl-gamma-glutamyl-phosphate reductase n=1 Tax=uncultured Thiohalocapsa sp. TaxID=768990 RepID=UPI0025CD8198|nr:N-acetyl-gamma-glutamyl-phosphate reductase [uncultured Thiohalocapsa sp.]